MSFPEDTVAVFALWIVSLSGFSQYRFQVPSFTLVFTDSFTVPFMLPLWANSTCACVPLIVLLPVPILIPAFTSLAFLTVVPSQVSVSVLPPDQVRV